MPRTCGAVVELRLEPIAGAARACSGGITGLRHESVNHPVKDDAVIEPFAGEPLDLLDMAGRKVRAQGNFDIAILSVRINVSSGLAVFGAHWLLRSIFVAMRTGTSILQALSDLRRDLPRHPRSYPSSACEAGDNSSRFRSAARADIGAELHPERSVSA